MGCPLSCYPLVPRANGCSIGVAFFSFLLRFALFRGCCASWLRASLRCFFAWCFFVPDLFCCPSSTPLLTVLVFSDMYFETISHSERRKHGPSSVAVLGNVYKNHLQAAERQSRSTVFFAQRSTAMANQDGFGCKRHLHGPMNLPQQLIRYNGQGNALYIFRSIIPRTPNPDPTPYRYIAFQFRFRLEVNENQVMRKSEVQAPQ